MSIAAVANPTTSTTTTTAAASAAASAKDAVSQDRFLTLLTAQLQAQDPLNPLDNAQLTSQLAQISTVDGIDKLNTTVEKLLGQLGSIDQLNATSTIGHNVLIAGDRIELSHTDAGDAVAGGAIQLAGNAADVKVQVRDAAGNVLRTIDLGQADSGINVFSWDGKTDAGAAAPDGRYSFSVLANATGGAAVTADALSIARVDGVQRKADGSLQLDLGGFGLIAQSDVKQIF